MRGKLPMSCADWRRVLRVDDDELRSDDDDYNAVPCLLGKLRFLVVAGVKWLETHEQQLRRCRRRLFLCCAVVFGKQLRPGFGPLYGPVDVNDNDDAGPVLVLLLVDDVLDNNDPRTLFIKLRLQVVDRVVGVVQGPRPLRGELPMSDAVENVVGRRVRRRARSLRRDYDDDDDDNDLDDDDDRPVFGKLSLGLRFRRVAMGGIELCRNAPV